jgi:hypothetical protein
VRRIALLAVAVGALAAAATAWAVTNTVTYTVTLKKATSGKPTAKKPIRVAYNAVLKIDSDPTGSQPDTAPGQPTFPSKCNKAQVGSGTASALAGSPGSPASNSVKEDLNVKFYNGKAGKQILLVLNSAPTAPVAITNRVVPGDLAGGTGNFGYRVDFKIPEDLQNQLGLSIALTDFKVAITNKAFKVKKHGKTVSVGYLELTGCPGTLPIRAIGHFKDAAGATTDITNDSTAKC